MGEKYDLSLVFIESRLSEELNEKYRKKKGPANVLSFPLDKGSGEIFIDLQKAKKEGAAFNLSYGQFLRLLFIHSLLHLKGFRHGSKMEKKESQLKERHP